MPMKGPATALLTALTAFCCMAASAGERPCGQQAPCPPIVLEGPLPSPWPADDPDALASLPVLGVPAHYIVEEFFVSGRGNVFNYNQPQATLGDAPGDNLVLSQDDVPYKTRFVVTRPVQPGRFNGTVIIEFLNSTAGRDGSPVWDYSGPWFSKQGIVHIGVTTSGDDSLPYLTRGCGGVTDVDCGDRYASLSIPDNGLEFEIVSQLASALKSGLPDQLPLPQDFPPVRRVFITAYSQQAASVLTLAAQFHQDDIDGYFPLANGFARPISGVINPVSGDGVKAYCRHPDAEPYPACIGELAPGVPTVRTNLPVPLYHGMTETEVTLVGPATYRQADTDTSPYASYRLFELPGVSHVGKLSEGARSLLDLEALCAQKPYYLNTPVNGIDVFNAYWQAMHLQVDYGILPPHAPRIDTDAGGNILRDADGNALGGLRLPEFEYPKARHFAAVNSNKPICQANNPVPGCVTVPPAQVRNVLVGCLLLGAQEPFSAAELSIRYPVPGLYARDFSLHTLELAKQRLLLPEDARRRLIAVARGEL